MGSLQITMGIVFFILLKTLTMLAEQKELDHRRGDNKQQILSMFVSPPARRTWFYGALVPPKVESSSALVRSIFFKPKQVVSHHLNSQRQLHFATSHFYLQDLSFSKILRWELELWPTGGPLWWNCRARIPLPDWNGSLMWEVSNPLC